MCEAKVSACPPIPAGPWYSVCATYADPAFEAACRSPRLPHPDEPLELLIIDLRTGDWGLYCIPDNTWKNPGCLSTHVRTEAARFIATLSLLADDTSSAEAYKLEEGLRYGSDEARVNLLRDEDRTLPVQRVKDLGPWYCLPEYSGRSEHLYYYLASQRPYTGTLLVVDGLTGTMGLYDTAARQWLEAADLPRKTMREAEAFMEDSYAELAAAAALDASVRERVQYRGEPL